MCPGHRLTGGRMLPCTDPTPPNHARSWRDGLRPPARPIGGRIMRHRRIDDGVREYGLVNVERGSRLIPRRSRSFDLNMLAALDLLSAVADVCRSMKAARISRPNG